MLIRTAILMAFAILIVIVIPARGQTADNDCPPHGAECDGIEVTETRTFEMYTPHCTFEAEYTRKNCNDGSFQLVLIGITAIDGCSGFSSLEIDGLSLNTFIEIAQLAIIQQLVQTGEPWAGQMADCDATATVVQFYSANCWVWQKCSYDITGATPVCDTPPQPQVPPTNKIDIWKWHDCGRTCCKRTYEVCRNPLPVEGNGPQTIEIRGMTVQKISDCTLKDNFQKACSDGC